jgi:hypothetical protein
MVADKNSGKISGQKTDPAGNKIFPGAHCYFFPCWNGITP